MKKKNREVKGIFLVILLVFLTFLMYPVIRLLFDYVDPKEGNFTLTESVAVVDKGDKNLELAMEMADCIIQNSRAGLQEVYPVPLYEGEPEDVENKSGNPKVFEEKLTVDLLKQHQELSESCKPE